MHTVLEYLSERLVELIESGYELDEDRSLAARDIEPTAVQTARVPA